MTNYLIQIGLPLLGIVGLIVTLGILGKRLNLSKVQSQSPIKVVASSPLSSQVKLCLVEVGGQQLLLSVSAQQTTCLHTLQERLPANKVGTTEFSDYLTNLLNRNSA
ncbi:flagellar biosynthetic protein FliO [Parendozoicomonas sp. Alg238-R29]|uniref:FliO/MopB family protein n=1 Tax=Parendozoicomonas sp. Alg238-R29 TaxID=2993446 RepID=UPI00248E5262|nr:flagellar biosynthetic protein FliO [Parendozoicomonas sp. Alg238-R29]